MRTKRGFYAAQQPRRPAAYESVADVSAAAAASAASAALVAVASVPVRLRSVYLFCRHGVPGQRERLQLM